eukprot:Colp12_sorted_trinity150504_noHs@32201
MGELGHGLSSGKAKPALLFPDSVWEHWEKIYDRNIFRGVTLRFKDQSLEDCYDWYSLRCSLKWARILIIALSGFRGAYAVYHRIFADTTLPVDILNLYVYITCGFLFVQAILFGLTFKKSVFEKHALSLAQVSMLATSSTYVIEGIFIWVHAEDTANRVSIVPLLLSFVCNVLCDEFSFAFTAMASALFVIGLFVSCIHSAYGYPLGNNLGYLAANCLLLYSGWESKRHTRLIFYNYVRLFQEGGDQKLMVSFRKRVKDAGSHWTRKVDGYGAALQREEKLSRQSYNVWKVFPEGDDQFGSTRKTQMHAVIQRISVARFTHNEAQKALSAGSEDSDYESNKGASGNFSETRCQSGFVGVNSARGSLRKWWSEFRQNYVKLGFGDLSLEKRYGEFLRQETIPSFRIVLFSQFVINTVTCVYGYFKQPVDIPELLNIQLPIVTVVLLFATVLTLTKLQISKLHILMCSTQLSIFAVNCLLSRYATHKQYPCINTSSQCLSYDFVVAWFAYNLTSIALDTASLLKLPIHIVWLFFLFCTPLFFGLAGILQFRLAWPTIALVGATAKFSATLEQKLRLQFILKGDDHTEEEIDDLRFTISDGLDQVQT